MESDFRELFRSIADTRPPFPTVWVEPRLLPPHAPTWMRPGTFDEAQLVRLSAAVCRAGVGTLTDCLWAGARVFGVWEAGNAEIAFNAHSFEQRGFGETARTLCEAYDAACEFARDPTRRAAHDASVLAVDFDGVRETVELLQSAHFENT